MQGQKGNAAQADAAVQNGVIQHSPLRPQKDGDPGQKYVSDDSQKDAGCPHEIGEEGKQAVCLFPVTLPQGLADQGGASKPDHIAHCPQHHNKGHDDIQSGKGDLPHIVGDKVAVHDAVYRGKDYAGNGRQCEPEQAPVGKVVGKLNGCFHNVLLLSCACSSSRRFVFSRLVSSR